MKSFWQSLPKPFFAMAPMADVTDPAYRRLIAEIKTPDVTWTEFVSADGLFHTRNPRKDGSTIYSTDTENPLVRDLEFTEGERPILAQFFGSSLETMEYAAALARERGFDGVDINMGCPDKSIEKQGAGAAHIKDPTHARKVIKAALTGAGGLPVSVKTRLGFNTMEWKEWLPHILEEDISALTLHLRTRKEMSKVPAHWELAEEIAQFVKERRPDIILIGNGDILTLEDGRKKAEASGFDGLMLGRAIFGNPWLFTGRKLEEVSQEEKLQALLTLARYFDELQPRKHYAILKKHFKAFVNGFDGAAELRGKLMETNTFPELEAVLK
jgi:tRNA-dihydrouridine synthase